MKKVLSFLLTAALLMSFASAAAAAPAVYSSEPFTYFYEGETVSTVTRYELELTDDTHAVWSSLMAQEGCSDTVNRLYGTYTVEGDEIAFVQNVCTESVDRPVTVFLIRNGMIAEEPYTTWMDPGTALAVGVSNGTGEGCEGAVLDVKTFNRAVLTLPDGRTYSGSLNMVDNGWDYYGTDATGDWFNSLIRFTENGDFTFAESAPLTYEPFAGTYRLTGDLGEIVLTVGENGESSAVVPWQGMKIYLTGYPYITELARIPSGAYLSDEYGFSADLTFTELEDGTFNYYGTFTFPLAAG